MASTSKRLARARKIRSQIGREFDRLSSGEITLVELLRDPKASPLRRCDVWDVIRRAPHMGRAGARSVFVKSKVFPNTKLGNLTEQERETIIAKLPPRAR